MNYRGGGGLGRGGGVTGPGEGLGALDSLVEHVCAGRLKDVRQPNDRELAQTLILALPLAEASAKIREGGPVDEEEDYALPLWAGVIPLRLTPQPAEVDARLGKGIARPLYADEYRRRVKGEE